MTVKELIYYAFIGAGLVIWFLRLESKSSKYVILNDAKVKAVELKIDNHVKLSKEKEDRIFTMSEKMTQGMLEINIALAHIAEQLTHLDKELKKN